MTLIQSSQRQCHFEYYYVERCYFKKIIFPTYDVQCVVDKWIPFPRVSDLACRRRWLRWKCRPIRTQMIARFYFATKRNSWLSSSFFHFFSGWNYFFQDRKHTFWKKLSSLVRNEIDSEKALNTYFSDHVLENHNPLGQ